MMRFRLHVSHLLSSHSDIKYLFTASPPPKFYANLAQLNEGSVC
jgi:hypothetical protein